MKATTILALATSLGGAVATFKDAASFGCPRNTDNKCEDKQKSGFDWTDLPVGPVGDYHSFNFKGWTCKDGLDKRNPHLSARTGGKAITGKCTSKKETSPSFGCGFGGNVDKFSITHVDLSVEFDCDLEFHFDMPEGKSCKQRSRCSKGGSTVENTQCGGAKNVTVVFPDTPSAPKKDCDIAVHKINFDCNPAETPSTPKTTTTSPAETSTAPPENTTTSPSGEETSTTTPAEDTTTSPAAEDTSTSPAAQDTTTSPAAEDTTTSSSPAETSAETTETSVETVVETTQSTSTIFTTTVETVTSCGPDVPNCPGGKPTGPIIVTKTVPLTTTVCPVTQTKTKVHTKTKSGPKPTKSSNPNPETTKASPETTKSKSSPETTKTPEQPSLPCPDVVPSCLNTWMFTVACKDNTDTACFCPNEVFVTNIFTCLYAYGETDTIISQAVVFFQGLCAPHAPQNPAIVTGAETVTAVITETAKPTIAAAYTTIVVTATQVVPCTTEGGSTISGSSTTQVVEQTVAVPEVGFQTGSSGVEVVATKAGGSGGSGNTGVFVPTLSTAVVGTGTLKPTSSPTGVAVTAGAAKVGSGIVAFGIAAIVGVIAL